MSQSLDTYPQSSSAMHMQSIRHLSHISPHYVRHPPDIRSAMSSDIGWAMSAEHFPVRLVLSADAICAALPETRELSSRQTAAVKTERVRQKPRRCRAEKGIDLTSNTERCIFEVTVAIRRKLCDLEHRARVQAFLCPGKFYIVDF